MRRLGDVLRRLWRKGYITEEQVRENDYDLLTEILRRRRESRNTLDGLTNASLVLDAYLEMFNSNEFDNAEVTNEVLTNVLQEIEAL